LVRVQLELGVKAAKGSLLRDWEKNFQSSKPKIQSKLFAYTWSHGLKLGN
jgi:hypothetical protein